MLAEQFGSQNEGKDKKMYSERYWKKLVREWFNQKYLLKKFLGLGGYGAVFQADEVIANRFIRKVAIKVMGIEPDELDLQISELQLAAKLQHRHLINCYTPEQGEINGETFLGLVMELAEGSLVNYLEKKQQSKLELGELKKLIQSLADALQFIHSQGIVHCDIKPGNILRVDNQWKLGDFGISRLLQTGRTTYTTGKPIGTFMYMPPECYDQTISTAWDMWSLGTMTVEMLTGNHPFPAKTIPELMKKVLFSPPDMPSNMPSPFKEIIQGCLEKEREKRWSAQQVLKALNSPASVASTPKTIVIRSPSQSCPSSISSSSQIKSFTEKVILDQTLGRKIYLELEMVSISPGEFLMGSPDSYNWAPSSEKPQHRVKISPFLIGKYPITQEQWQAIMSHNPSQFKRGGQYSLLTVSWYDAQEFCQQLSQLTGKNYRLPTEAEWEYACRAGSETKYYFRNDANKLKEYAWYSYNSNDQTEPVEKKKPNGWGIYNMTGNVWEWCEDDWHENYQGAPTDGKAWIDKNDNCSQNNKVLRGGSWFYYPFNWPSAVRVRNYANGRSSLNGFRLACSPSTPTILS